MSEVPLPFVHRPTSTRRDRALTFMEELHIQFEARLLANDDQLVPLAQSIPPSPEQIERIRQRTIEQTRQGTPSTKGRL